MSIVSMQKMSLVAHSSERTRLLRIFIKLGCVELLKSEENVVVTPADRERREEVEARKFRAAFAMSFLKETAKEIVRYDKKDKVKVDLKRENRLIPLEEYEEVCNNTEEISEKIDEMESINNRIVDMRNEKTRLNAVKERLLPYKDLTIDVSEIRKNDKIAVICGFIPSEKKQQLEEKLNEKIPYEWEVASGEKFSAIALVCLASDVEVLTAILSENEFVSANFDFSGRVADKLREIETRTKEIDDTVKELIFSVKNYVKYLPTIKIIYDYNALELAKLDITENSARTKKAIAFEGWVPLDKVKALTDEINDKCSKVEFAFRDPLDDEIPPTQTKNSKIVSAFSGITSMFGAPNYRERDPNLFVAFFYFLIFGIMIGDAGYGLIMAIACFLFVKIKKPVKNSGQMMIMFAFCGISTVIWGVLFGGWFAIEHLPPFLKAIKWFSPLDEPLKMFMLSLTIGVLQIGTGFALSGIAKIETKKPVNIVKGILSDFGWVIILIGLLMLFPNVLCFMDPGVTKLAWFDTLASVGMYVAIAGAAMMLVGGAVGKKNPVKMIGGSLGSAYGAINVVSDLLSYSRLFGLGLTTGVIGLVMNKLGMLIAEMIPVIGWVIAVIIFVGGHVFNLAINLLGAYVHDSRLQYIEFFGRFYEGSGHAFKPLGGEMKYTYLDN